MNPHEKTAGKDCKCNHKAGQQACECCSPHKGKSASAHEHKEHKAGHAGHHKPEKK